MGAEALIIGAGLSAYASLKQGESQKRAYEMEASAKRAQAAQVDIAAGREIELTQRRAEKITAAQMVAFGRSGVLATTGTPLAMMEETAATAADEISAIRNAANYRKGSLLTEAGFSLQLGQEAEDASYYNAAGSILGGFSKSPYAYDQKVGGGNL